MTLRTALRPFSVFFFGLILCGMSYAAQPNGTATVPKPDAAATSQAARAQADRLTILTNEYNIVSKQLADAEKAQKPDAVAIARLESDLAALRKEIDLARRNPVPVVSMSSKPVQQVSASVAPATASQPASDDPPQQAVEYESWDIFQNFGHSKRGSKQ